MALQDLPTDELFVVDDDVMIRDALSIVFTLAGYRVTGFAEDHRPFLRPQAITRPHVYCSICICPINPA